jgi:tetratricopeptide (TPR) repeat protein
MEEARQEANLPLEEIVAKDPATALYLPLAEKLRERGRVEEAIRLCEERRHRPGAGVGDRVVLGRAYLADGRLAEACAEFEAALEADRENVVALKALAGILSHQGDHAQAAGYYRAVCRVDPGDLESQTALHQITSGEYPEIRPPDVVVGPGDLTWQPVGLPREEEHLSELALGLRTIERFDTPSPEPYAARVQQFQELPLEAVEAGAPEPAPSGSPAAEPTPPPPPATAARTSSGEPPAAAANPGARGGAVVQGNRSAFEEWIGRLGGSSS